LRRFGCLPAASQAEAGLICGFFVGADAAALTAYGEKKLPALKGFNQKAGAA
jgi:hypothetical protein